MHNGQHASYRLWLLYSALPCVAVGEVQRPHLQHHEHGDQAGGGDGGRADRRQCGGHRHDHRAAQAQGDSMRLAGTPVTPSYELSVLRGNRGA